MGLEDRDVRPSFLQEIERQRSALLEDSDTLPLLSESATGQQKAESRAGAPTSQGSEEAAHTGNDIGVASVGSPGLPSPVTASHIYSVTIFCITAALLFADQNLMAPNMTAIARSFGFNGDQRDTFLGGYISAAFYIVGAPAAVLFGYLSHGISRRLLLLVAVLMGEAPCLLTVLVTKYWQLFLLRLLTGISIGGSLPVIFSLLSDMYEPEHRALVSAVVQVAIGAGIAAGQGISGFVGPVIGWRWPFAIIAIPAVIAALIMFFTTEEPAQGSTEAVVQVRHARDRTESYHGHFTARKVLILVQIRTNLICIVQGLPGCLPWGMVLTFMNDFLAQDKGLSVSTATTLVLAVGIGGAVGVLGGGFIGQQMYNCKPRLMPLFIGCCTLAGTLPLWVLVSAEIKGHFYFAFLLAFITGVMSSTVGPNVRAMIMNVNEPETRGVALALQTTLDDLGKGLGPAIVAFMISGLGRETAFLWAAAGWIPCGLLLLLAYFTLEADEMAMQARMKESIVRDGSELVAYS